mmetsp:Transcript_29332/g.86921  ORF Transcript_29332/g.86921 Transcript_29332/m.86921 type:complete len:234 (-) Transcript_29332:1411-2112(-)
MVRRSAGVYAAVEGLEIEERTLDDHGLIVDRSITGTADGTGKDRRLLPGQRQVLHLGAGMDGDNAGGQDRLTDDAVLLALLHVSVERYSLNAADVASFAAITIGGQCRSAGMRKRLALLQVLPGGYGLDAIGSRPRVAGRRRRRYPSTDGLSAGCSVLRRTPILLLLGLLQQRRLLGRRWLVISVSRPNFANQTPPDFHVDAPGRVPFLPLGHRSSRLLVRRFLRFGAVTIPP